jgi:hypothetical protein
MKNQHQDNNVAVIVNTIVDTLYSYLCIKAKKCIFFVRVWFSGRGAAEA